MKISELIKKLEEIQKEEGDLPVYTIEVEYEEKRFGGIQLFDTYYEVENISVQHPKGQVKAVFI